jgi:hypothetical protein
MVALKDYAGIYQWIRTQNQEVETFDDLKDGFVYCDLLVKARGDTALEERSWIGLFAALRSMGAAVDVRVADLIAADADAHLQMLSLLQRILADTARAETAQLERLAERLEQELEDRFAAAQSVRTAAEQVEDERNFYARKLDHMLKAADSFLEKDPGSELAARVCHVVVSVPDGFEEPR